MNKLLINLVAIAGLAVAGTAGAATSMLTKDQYTGEKARIESAYKADETRCNSLAGNAKDVCVLEVKGTRDVALADAEAGFKNTPAARFDARVARVEATYKVAKEKCDDLSGNNKDVCVKEAKAAEVRGKADAKVDKVATESSQDAMKKTAEARQDAAEDKRDADYKVAVERCDTLAGDAKDQCVKAAKMRFGKS